jgi:hypothetical protein
VIAITIRCLGVKKDVPQDPAGYVSQIFLETCLFFGDFFESSCTYDEFEIIAHWYFDCVNDLLANIHLLVTAQQVPPISRMRYPQDPLPQNSTRE